MPTHFDEVTVRQLITDINKPQNGIILKIGYFARYRGGSAGQDDVSPSQVLSYLEEAVNIEQPDSERWIRLKSLVGFAAFRIRPSNAQQKEELAKMGYGAYKSICDEITNAPVLDKRHIYLGREAIGDLISVVSGPFVRDHLNESPETIEVLRKAWGAYVELVKADPSWQGHEPNWIEALDNAKTTDLSPEVVKTCDDPKSPKTFTILLIAGYVLRQKRPEEAIKLLRQAKSLAPSSRLDSGGPRIEVIELYDILVGILSGAEDLKEAMKEEQEEINKIGVGLPRLLSLEIDAGGEKAIVDTIAVLSNPDTSLNDLFDSVSLLDSASAARPSLRLHAVELLQAYLKWPETKRDPAADRFAQSWLKSLEPKID